MDNPQSQQLTKFRTKHRVEKNDDFGRLYNTNSQIKFKTTVLKLRLCDYSDAYIPLKGTMTIAGHRDEVFENFAPFNDSINKVNNTQLDNGNNLDVVMRVYNLIEYSVIYLKTS